MGNSVGRPPKYKSVAEMQKKIDEYFEDCKGHVLRENGEIVYDKNGKPVIAGVRPLTVTGLALALGFTSRQALLNYQGKPGFIDAITRAKLKCEEYTESRLYDRDGANGAKFSLKNNFKGWKENPEDDTINAGGVKIIVTTENGDEDAEEIDEWSG